MVQNNKYILILTWYWKKPKVTLCSTLSTQKSLEKAKNGHAVPQCDHQRAHAALGYLHSLHQVLEKWSCQVVLLDWCVHIPRRGFNTALWSDLSLGPTSDKLLPHWILETVPPGRSNIWVQHWAEAPIQQSMFRDVWTQVNPHSDGGCLGASCCCQGVSLTGMHLVFPQGAKIQASLQLLCGSTYSSLAYQTSQAAAPVSARVLFLYHTRASLRAAWLLGAKAAFHYSGQSSLSGLWGIRLWDQTLLSGVAPTDVQGSFVCVETDLSLCCSWESCTACSGNHEQRAFLLEWITFARFNLFK